MELIENTGETDVVVVGAGPVGLAVAAELRQFGVDCVVLEKRTEPAAGSRALTVHARTMELLNLRGLSQDFIARGRMVGDATIIARPGRCARLRFEELDSPFPFVLILPQAETEELLEGHLRSLGGQPQGGLTVTGVENQADHVVVTVTEESARSRRIRARWLVAADGARSTVRDLLRAPTRGDREGLAYYGADVSLDGVPAELQMIWSKAGFGVLVPYLDGTFRIAVTSPAVAQLPANPTLTDLQQQVDRVFPHPLMLRNPTWLTSLHSGHRQLANYRHGRVLFAGDAAHTHNPAGGQGMNTGLQDAFNLGWKLADVIRGDALETLLDTYDEERRPAAARVIAQTTRTMRLAHLRSAPLRMARDEVLRALPAAGRRQLLNQVSGLDVDYAAERSKFSAGNSGRRLPSGARLADIPVMTHDGRATTLHTMLRAAGHAEIRYSANELTVRTETAAETVRDHRAAARRKLGMAEGTVLRIRPDGYIAGPVPTAARTGARPRRD